MKIKICLYKEEKLMRLLADTVTKQVRGRGIAMLEKPPGDV